MVVIRLTRSGAKKRPFYHVVVADQRKPRDGRFIEQLGHYNPVSKDKNYLRFDLERMTYWINNGAQPSERVGHLMQEFLQLQATQAKAAVTKGTEEPKEAVEAVVAATDVKETTTSE